MAKKSIVQREKKRRLLTSKFYVLRKILTEKIKSSISYEEKLFFYSQLQKLPRDSSFSRLHNRCLVTGRGRGFYRMFGLSRHVLRDMSHYGFLPGVTKSSW
uniref:Small ribosomal subunit protein uS14c n=1 Tax=Monomorphina parapyrum TaxID=1664066 RepID=A0A0G3VID0_9EUGL|nr:ribosomal protein S14 [Monomorphina parapyrum]AKL78943.1 ribosomal protein S14 [Monomorphina parapyrum]